MALAEPEESLLTRVSWYYYIQGMTQEEISARLGFSRTKVVRLLERARREGIVRISVTGTYTACLEKEERLKARFSLKDAVVVPTGKDFPSSKSGVGRACAQYLDRVLDRGDVFGVAWGTTLYGVGQSLAPRSDLDITVVQLMGGLNAGEELNPQEIVRRIASKLGARGVWLNTPAVVANPGTKKALLADAGVLEVLARAKDCTKALLGIGDMSPTASLFVSGALAKEEMDNLVSLGAVGDIMGWHFDENGEPISSPVGDRVISVPLEDLAHIGLRVGVACGDKKVKPFVGALRGKHINVIVTDESTAEKILSQG
jgi:DNA-binding transcriptional regulator LsrR (DeoR family)